ncbi:MAG: metallophosphoesterase [Polyangiaceae bacterium]|nr:metallophosphoesterase [Polyangiaceae bacterium]
MTVLVQISDTHFGTEQPLVVAALLKLIEHEKPELALLTGDITQRARPGEFAEAKRFVDRLGPVRTLVIPGNHDIPLFNPIARFFRPYANFSSAFGAELEPEYESESLLVLCVNTTRPGRHVDGEVSDAQIDRIASRLQAAKSSQLRIVVTHQPVHVVRDEDVDNLLHGHAKAVRTWSHAGVDLILGGHIHVPYAVELPTKVAPRGGWVVQAGTAVSNRVRDGIPNSINLIRRTTPGEAHCEIERWDYLALEQAFCCVDRSYVSLARRATTEVAPSAHAGAFPR